MQTPKSRKRQEWGSVSQWTGAGKCRRRCLYKMNCLEESHGFFLHMAMFLLRQEWNGLGQSLPVDSHRQVEAPIKCMVWWRAMRILFVMHMDSVGPVAGWARSAVRGSMAASLKAYQAKDWYMF